MFGSMFNGVVRKKRYKDGSSSYRVQTYDSIIQFPTKRKAQDYAFYMRSERISYRIFDHKGRIIDSFYW